MASYEQYLSSGMYSSSNDKSFLDKTLAKEESTKIESLMSKEYLTRSDCLKILFLLTAIDAKLNNITEMERYILTLFFTWIREFVAKAELIFDFKDDYLAGEVKLSKDELDIIQEIQRIDLHNMKFLVDVYLMIAHSSLSVRGVAFDTLSKNRFEYSYPAQNNGMPNTDPRSNYSINIKK